MKKKIYANISLKEPANDIEIDIKIKLQKDNIVDQLVQIAKELNTRFKNAVLESIYFFEEKEIKPNPTPAPPNKNNM